MGSQVSYFNIGSRVWAYIPRRRWRSAARPEEIVGATDSKVRQRSKQCKASLARSMRKYSVWLFRVQCQGGKGPYIVKVKAFPDPKKLRRRTKTDVFVGESDVAVTCSCPFWRWNGPDYNAKQGEFLYQKPKSNQSAPDIRDPKRVYKVCKHAVVALEKAATYAVEK